MATVRVGVIGGGLISQAIHLPFLSQLRDRFALTALAEPSEMVRTELGRRYEIPGIYGDHVRLLEAGGIDALVVCSPHATHAKVVTDALDAGLHVFVEKPLCISLADADRIIAARSASGRIVQVGYTKRFDVAYAAMCEDLPESIADLRYISVLTHEPELSQYFRPADMVVGADLSEEFCEASRCEEQDQVASAVGTRDRHDVFVFSEIYLGSLVHDVNLVHGLLERMNEPLPCSVSDSGWWEGPSATASLRLSSGARWGLTWIETTKLHDFREQISLFFEDAVHSITFPPPYLRHSGAIYERNSGSPERRESRVVSSYQERFVNELIHFHDCIVSGERCRTPPEQARRDIALLTDLFLAARGGGQDPIDPRAAHTHQA